MLYRIVLCTLVAMLMGCASGTMRTGAQVAYPSDPNAHSSPIEAKFLSAAEANDFYYQIDVEYICSDCEIPNDVIKMSGELQKISLDRVYKIEKRYFNFKKLGAALCTTGTGVNEPKIPVFGYSFDNDGSPLKYSHTIITITAPTPSDTTVTINVDFAYTAREEINRELIVDSINTASKLYPTKLSFIAKAAIAEKASDIIDIMNKRFKFESSETRSVKLFSKFKTTSDGPTITARTAYLPLIYETKDGSQFYAGAFKFTTNISATAFRSARVSNDIIPNYRGLGISAISTSNINKETLPLVDFIEKSKRIFKDLTTPSAAAEFLETTYGQLINEHMLSNYDAAFCINTIAQAHSKYSTEREYTIPRGAGARYDIILYKSKVPTKTNYEFSKQERSILVRKIAESEGELGKINTLLHDYIEKCKRYGADEADIYSYLIPLTRDPMFSTQEQRGRFEALLPYEDMLSKK